MTHLEEVEQAINACREGERPQEGARRANAVLARLRRCYPDKWNHLTATEYFDIAYLVNHYAADPARRLAALQRIAAYLCIEPN